MTQTAAKPLTGRKVAIMMVACFSVIIGVNLTLAFKAVATFPGLEVKNSYVASQSFDADRAAQLALDWDVSAQVDAGILQLYILQDGQPVRATVQSAVFGRATNVAEDQFPNLVFDGAAYTALVHVADGNWNLRLIAKADDGTLFKQRVIVRVTR